MNGALPCTWRVQPHVPGGYIRSLSCSYLSFLLSFLLVYIRKAWTKNDNETKPSLGSGRSPKRIGPSTLPSHGMANIAGFDPPMLCAWSTTGAVYDLTARSAVDQPFVALTEATAAIQSPTGAIFTYRKHNKPALGPTGDSLDDLA